MDMTHTSRFDAPPERVADVYCSEEFQLGMERERDGVVETEYVTLRDDAGQRVFELRSREYKRTMTGALDRSGTVAARNHNEYDREAGTIRWRYESGNTDRVDVSGVYRFQPDGDGGTRLVHDVKVDVRIPLVGGRVAKYIAGEMEKSLTEQDRRIAKVLAGDS